MSDCINFGIIGCGAISEKHGQAMSQVEGARLVAVADVIEERARVFASKYLPKPDKVYLDYRCMLDDPDVHAVIVATPSGLHAKMGIDVLDAGKHVLIEKPLALTSRDAQSLIDKAKAVGKCLGTVHPNRYYPTSQLAHQAIQRGRLGKLSHVVASLRWNRTQAYYDEAPWRKTRSMDGGVLFNQAWHAIDLMFWLAGSSVAEVRGMADRRLHDIETEDVALAVIRFVDGTLGLVEATTNVYPRNLEQTVSVFGATGTIVLGGVRADAVRVWKVAGDSEDAVLAQWSEHHAPRLDPSWAHKQCITGFIETVQAASTGSLREEVLHAVQEIELIERAIGLA